MASTCPGHCLGRGIHSGVKGAGTNMSDTGGLIVYDIIVRKLPLWKLRGEGARAP